MEVHAFLFIVEGKTDKRRLLQFLPPSTNILVTNGYVDEERLLDLLEPYEEYEFVTLFDADANGDFYRQLMNRIYPEAVQIQIPLKYKEVAETPVSVLQKLISESIKKVSF
jgi:toprim domain protein